MAMRSLEIDYLPNTSERLSGLIELDGFVFLDSCQPGSTDGRFDIISALPSKMLSVDNERVQVRDNNGSRTITDDPFEILAAYLLERPQQSTGLPFFGGLMGYFSYDLGRRIERLPSLAARDIPLQEMHVGVYEWAAVVDHQEEKAWVVAPDDSDEDLERWANLIGYKQPLTPAAFATSFQVLNPARPEISFDDYARQFRKIKKYIKDGDCYQVNYAQRFSATVEGHSWDAYRRLRNLNPAPFAAYLSLPGATILSSSPERFLQLADGFVETKPIKGTAARDKDPEVDARAALDLANSEKDRAENVMIVDLMRNDIGKSCEIGSVEVSALLNVESFAKVHHLVSTVRGKLGNDKSAIELLKGCFPGGSITGAPKLRAMEIIEELEPTLRSIYCGSIGYVGFDGGMDTNIAIRTLLHHKDKMYCWAGGGIVDDSELHSEYQESLDKAAAMLDVFSHAESQYIRR